MMDEDGPSLTPIGVVALMIFVSLVVVAVFVGMAVVSPFVEDDALPLLSTLDFDDEYDDDEPSVLLLASLSVDEDSTANNKVGCRPRCPFEFDDIFFCSRLTKAGVELVEQYLRRPRCCS